MKDTSWLTLSISCHWPVDFYGGRITLFIVMDLIIIRHGLPNRQENAEHEGPADPPLSELGQAQAEAVAEYLVGEHIDHVVASTMVRAHQTSLPLAKMIGSEIELRDDLREVDQHRNQYVPAEEMTLEDPFLQKMMKDPMSLFEGNFEGFRDTVVGGFDSVISANKGKRVAVFCHAMVTAVYLQALWNLDSPFRMQTDYTSITRVQASSSSERRTVRSINEIGHVRHMLTVHKGFPKIAPPRDT
jgi:probable phosphoglycerate mutase